MKEHQLHEHIESDLQLLQAVSGPLHDLYTKHTEQQAHHTLVFIMFVYSEYCFSNFTLSSGRIISELKKLLWRKTVNIMNYVHKISIRGNIMDR